MKPKKTYFILIMLTLILCISVGLEVRAASNGFMITDDTGQEIIPNQTGPFDIHITMEKREKKEDYAHDVTLTLYSSSGTPLRSWTRLGIPAGVDVAIVNDVFWTTEVQVYLKVTGYIYKNKNNDDYFEATSNIFSIKPLTPPPTPSGLGQILWEKEILN